MKMLRTSRQASRKNSATPVHPEAGSARLILINWSVYQPPVSDKRLVGPAKEWQKQRPVVGAERLGNGFDVGGLPRRVAEVRQQGDNHGRIGHRMASDRPRNQRDSRLRMRNLTVSLRKRGIVQRKQTIEGTREVSQREEL